LHGAADYEGLLDLVAWTINQMGEFMDRVGEPEPPARGHPETPSP
jgi:hypothetical protein